MPPFNTLTGRKANHEFCAMRHAFNASFEASMHPGGEEEEARTAIHECGHLFCLWYLEEAAAFLEITIVPVGQVLGSVTSEGRNNCSRKQMFANIMLKYGGKCAEEIFFGASSAGCRADMQEARAFAMELANTRRSVHEVLAEAEQKTRDLLDTDDMRTNLKKVAMRLFWEKSLQPDQIKKMLGCAPAAKGLEGRKRRKTRNRSSSSDSRFADATIINGKNITR